MTLKYVELSGFRGYRSKVRIKFGADFTVIDGRNGVGKSTIFDAVEFALTGTLTKYSDAKVDRETVEDYLWWMGAKAGPAEQYVKVGFEFDGKNIEVTRSSSQPGRADNLEFALEHLFDSNIERAPAVKQLCGSSIIRDELIAKLSLDLKETDRFALLSSTIGATGTDEWVEKSKEVLKLAKEGLERAQMIAERASQDRAQATLRVDEARSALLSEGEVRDATSSLQSLLGGRVGPEGISESARTVVTSLRRTIADLRQLIELSALKETAASEIEALLPEIERLQKRKFDFQATIENLSNQLLEVPVSEEFSGVADALAHLAEAGEKVGCENDTCPLCKSTVSEEQFGAGVQQLRNEANWLAEKSVEIAALKNNHDTLTRELATAVEKLERCEQDRTRLAEIIRQFDQRNTELQGEKPFSKADVAAQISKTVERINNITALLPIVDATGRTREIVSAESELAERRASTTQAERQLALARRTERDAQALHDGVRKAAGDAVTLRLERILPLITELYTRLRPHPTFGVIDYKMRGKVRRYLTFRVGEDINPQFVFSSGQRRATGLAFLIAVHLSIAWSKWKTLMLDDPVQHIDDFRSVHLAEVLGHLVSENRQIICAVEDPALAQLICRKMPIRTNGGGTRVTLGINDEGDVDVLESEELKGGSRRVLFQGPHDLAL